MLEGWLVALLFSSHLYFALLCSGRVVVDTSSTWLQLPPGLLHRAPSNRLLVVDEMTVDPRGAL